MAQNGAFLLGQGARLGLLARSRCMCSGGIVLSASLHTTVSSHDPHGPRLILFGKPGSGKGTLSQRLIDNYGFKLVSCGDILRRNILDKTELGQSAEAVIRSGGLVPDAVITSVVINALDQLREQPWILDGFPRTIKQGKFLLEHLRKCNIRVSFVVVLDVPDPVIVDRISNRWIHETSGRVYNLSYNKPKIAGIDDITGEALVRRADDRPDVIVQRLKNYEESTQPVLTYFKTQSDLPFKVVSLQGSTTDEIWPKLVQELQSSSATRL